MNLAAAKLFLEEQAAQGCSENIAFRCDASKRLEEAGDYAGACEVLGYRWRGASLRPDVNGLKTEEAALLLLRAGMLSHRIAVTEAREGAQDKAKDLLSEAARVFASQRDGIREAEALVGVGLCCLRQTALDEARIVLSEALARTGGKEGEQRVAALVTLAYVEWSDRNYEKSLRLLLDCEPMVRMHGSHRLRASYHCCLAFARR